MGEWYLLVRLLKYRMPTCRSTGRVTTPVSFALYKMHMLWLIETPTKLRPLCTILHHIPAPQLALPK